MGIRMAVDRWCPARKTGGIGSPARKVGVISPGGFLPHAIIFAERNPVCGTAQTPRNRGSVTIRIVCKTEARAEVSCLDVPNKFA